MSVSPEEERTQHRQKVRNMSDSVRQQERHRLGATARSRLEEEAAARNKKKSKVHRYETASLQKHFGQLQFTAGCPSAGPCGGWRITRMVFGHRSEKGLRRAVFPFVKEQQSLLPCMFHEIP